MSLRSQPRRAGVYTSARFFFVPFFFLFFLSKGAKADETAPSPTVGPVPIDPSPNPPNPSNPIDVNVTGDRTPRASQDPNVASYSIRGEALRRPGATAIDALARSPGTQISRTGAGSDLATLSIRGAPSASLPVYIAGVRINDDVTGTADLSTIALATMERVDLYRGNAPSSADRLGIGGALFFEPKLPRGTRVGASMGAGDFGEVNLSAFASAGSGAAGALFSVYWGRAQNNFTFTDTRETLDARDDTSVTRRNGDSDTVDAWAIGRLEVPRGGRVVLLANAFEREQGIVGPSVSPALFARSKTQRRIAAATTRFSCASAPPPASDTTAAQSPSHTPPADRCSLNLTSSVIVSRRSISDPLGELGFFAAHTDVFGERWLSSATLRLRPFDALEISGGLFAGVDRLRVSPRDREGTHAARASVTGSIDARLHVTQRVSVFALGGGECHSPLGGQNSACALGGPAGRAGVHLNLPLGIELIGSGGSYVRVPTLGEQFGLSGSVTGNPDLLPERGFTGELEARYSGGVGSLSWFLDVTAFARVAENLIAYRRTSAATIAPFNVANAQTLGAEVLAGINIGDYASLEQAMTLLDPRDVTENRNETNAQLPYQAAFTSSSRVEVGVNANSANMLFQRAALGTTFAYRSARTADSAGANWLPEQREFNIDATFWFLQKHIVARLALTNAFNVANQDILGFPLPSRALHGSLEGTW
ncbi:MAG: TonB-dependent receptor plug domain-containing protein [Polyangiaceae bacterium]|nr:TonB-dependent receptor plug domain-containing protein [Polyangiaceae bacterium]